MSDNDLLINELEQGMIDAANGAKSFAWPRIPQRLARWKCRHGSHRWSMWGRPETWENTKSKEPMFIVQRRVCLGCGEIEATKRRIGFMEPRER